VQQLSKLRDEASAAHRRELQARQGEAKALRELEDAKRYVDKRNSFVQSEKAELLLRVKDLEAIVKEVQDRESGLKQELQETASDMARAMERADEAGKDLHRWRTDALDRSAKLKQADLRIQQLEQKRSEDKTRMKALAEQLKLVVEGGLPIGGIEAFPVKGAPVPEKAPKAPSGKRGGPPAASASSRGAGAAAEGAPAGRGLCPRRFRAIFDRTARWGALGAAGSGTGSKASAPREGGTVAKKGRSTRHAHDALEELEAEAASRCRQRQVLLGLVFLIVALAATKIRERS